MNIFHIGQKGIPANSVYNTEETRVEALAIQAADRGHSVFVASTKPYTRRNLREYNGVNIVSAPSFNPEKAGGFLYIIWSMFKGIRLHPSVIHLHGWRAAALAGIARVMYMNATIILSVDHIPYKYPRVYSLGIARIAGRICDEITAPTRKTQYELLVSYGIRTEYIPDGYTASEVPDLSVSNFGLRKNQYVLALAENVQDIPAVIRAYKLVKSRKKLVFPIKDAPAYIKRLANKDTRIVLVPHEGTRTLYSLMRKSAGIVLAGHGIPTVTILHAMDAARPIIATIDPVYEETLGTSAQFVTKDDAKGLSDALTAVKNLQSPWGKKASQRARTHFTWDRVADEYIHIYHASEAVSVPIDSIVPKRITAY